MWGVMRDETILIALDVRAAIMILEISMLYTELWHEVLEGGGYNSERSMHYESFCAYIKKSDRHLYLIYNAVESQLSTQLFA